MVYNLDPGLLIIHPLLVPCNLGLCPSSLLYFAFTLTCMFPTLPTTLHHPRLLRAVSAGCLWCHFPSLHPLGVFYNSWHYWSSFSSLRFLFQKPHDTDPFFFSLYTFRFWNCIPPRACVIVSVTKTLKAVSVVQSSDIFYFQIRSPSRYPKGASNSAYFKLNASSSLYAPLQHLSL